MNNKIKNYQHHQKRQAVKLNFLISGYYETELIKYCHYLYNLLSLLFKYSKYRNVKNAVLLSGFIFILALITVFIFRPIYSVTPNDLKLTGPADVYISNQLKLSTNDKFWILGTRKQAHSINIGNTNKPSYGLKIPVNLNNGIQISDNQTGLSFEMDPSFITNSGKYINGHFIYPITNNSKAIYTIKANGLQEDIIIEHKVSQASYSFKLNLPNNLQAKKLPSGAIGIYSENPVLRGNVSASSKTAQNELANARKNSAKNYLIFALMPPLVKQTTNSKDNSRVNFSLNGNEVTIAASNLGKLSYPISIDPTVVDFNANSFALGNTSNLNVSNNGISVSGIVGGDICETACTGGFSAWQTPNNNASDFPTGFTNVAFAGSAIYDNTMYVVGGCIKTTSACDTLTNQIQFAPLASVGYGFTNSESWGIDTSLPVSLYQAGVATYNGYLYVVGGCTTLDCTQVSDNIYYRQLDPNGGGFMANSPWRSYTLPSAYSNGSISGGFGIAVATYSDYIYILGGCDAITGTGTSASCNAQSNVWHGLLNADGSLASLTQDSSYQFSNARFGASATAFNGYLYLAGGCSITAGDTSTLQNGTCTPDNDVQYAPLTPITSTSSPGSIAAVWTTSSNLFSTGRYAFGMTITDGYMYVIGGCSAINTSGIQNCSSPLSDVQYAQVDVDGEINPWFTDSSTLLNTANSTSDTFAGISIVANNNFIYTAGGSDGTNLNAVTFAPIDLGLPSSGWQAVDHGNWFFNSSSSLEQSIGSGAAVYSSPTGVNYMYYVGGMYVASDSVTEPVGAVYVTNLKSMTSTSTQPSFTQVGTLTTPVMDFGIAISGDFLYIIDGCNYWVGPGAVTTDWRCQVPYSSTLGATTAVQYYEINPNNGALCTPGSSNCNGCPTPGGSNTVNNYLTCTFSAQNVAPGAGPAYNPVALQGGCGGTASGVFGDPAVAVTYNGNNYLIDALGWDPAENCASTEVAYLGLNSDGSVNGSWVSSIESGISTAGSLYGESLIYDYDNQNLYIVGGIDGTNEKGNATSTTYYDSVSDVINNTQHWLTASNNVPDLYSFGVSGYSNGSIYVAAGAWTRNNDGDGVNAATYYAVVQNNGDIGAWQTMSDLTNARSSPAGFIYNGIMYAMGGSENYNNASPDQNAAIEDAWFNRVGNFVTGITSPWSINTSDNLPVPTADASTVIFNNKIYVLGGTIDNNGGNSTVTGVSNQVYFAQISPGGSLSAPSSTTCTPVTGTIWCSESLPNATYDFGAAAFNGYMYIAGGCSTTGTGFTPISDNCGSLLTGNNIYYSKINNSGTLTVPSTCTQVGSTPWCAINSPISSGDFGLNFDQNNGYLYILGGCTALTANNCNLSDYPTTIYYSQITTSAGSNGELETPASCTPVTGTNWCTSTNSLTLGRFLPSSVIYDGYLYVNGGMNRNNNGTCHLSWENYYCYDVDVSRISSNGNLGVWSSVAGTDPGSFRSLEAYNGFLYNYGNYNGYMGWAAYWPMNSDGTLNAGQGSPTFVDAAEGGAVNNGFLYAAGGYNNNFTSSVSSTRYYGWDLSVSIAGLKSSSHTGQYTQLLDLGKSGAGGDATPDYIINTGNDLVSGQNFNPTQFGLPGGVSISYMDATGSGSCAAQFNPSYLNIISPQLNILNPLGSSPQGQPQVLKLTNDGCGNQTDEARYIWLNYVIDDSQTFSFNGDSSTTLPNVTYLSRIDLFYHPSPNTYLRGGMSLVNGNKQSLDTIP